MKVFIAIDFEDEHKKRIYQEVKKLKLEAKKGSFVREENLHVTIQYIGEMHSEEVTILQKHVADFTFQPFEVQLSELSYFKRQDNQNIYYISIEKSTQLNHLVLQVQELLDDLGIEYDRKPYKGHITLGRRVILKEKHIPKMEIDDSYSIHVKQITLMESTFDQNRLIYKSVCRSTTRKKGNKFNEIS